METVNEPKNKKIFTDRVEAKELLWNTIDKQSQINIINYHGMAGIGKTSLLNQLINEIEQNRKDIKTVYIDVENFSTPIETLYSIRNLLMGKYKISFKKFDMALITYYGKMGKNQNSPEIKDIIESSIPVKIKGDKAFSIEPLRLIGDFISNISIGSFVAEKITEKLIQFFQSQINKEFINSLQFDSIKNLRDNLPIYMSEDISEFLVKKNYKLVFFIDTFEKLDESKIGSYTSIEKLKWLYSNSKKGLMNNLKNCIWVIASKEKIDYIPNIEKYELFKLDKNYSKYYLKNAGIQDENMCNIIFENYSKGIPLLLSTCVDCYNIDNGEFSEEEFLLSGQEIIERLIGNLDRDSQAVVYCLACIKSWNEDFILEIAPKCVNGFDSRYEDIKQLSFINNIEVDKYSFDKTARDIILLENTESAKSMKHIIDKTNRVLANYYKTKLQNKDTTISEKIIAIKEYINREKNLEYNFIKPYVMELEKLYLYNEELDVFELLEAKITDETFKNDITKNKINICYLLGKYKEQEQLAKVYYDKTKSIEAKEALGIAYMYNGKYDDSYIILNEIANQNSNDLKIIENLANVESRMGKYKIALEHYLQVLNNSKDEEVQKEMNKNIAKMYSFMGEYDKSIQLIKEILKIENENIRDKLLNNSEEISIDDLNLYNDLSNIYSNGNYFDKAYEIKIILKELYAKYLGTEHPNYLNIQNDIGIIYSHMGEYEKAISLLEETYQQRKMILGEMALSTIATLNNLGSVKLYYAKSGQIQKSKIEMLNLAYKDLRLAFVQRKQTLKEEHPITMSSLFNLALVQQELGENAEAEKNARIVYEFRKAKLGENHRDTKKAYELIKTFE